MCYCYISMCIVWGIYYAKYYGGGGGDSGSGKKLNKRKGKGENYIKNGVKRLKIASFWVITMICFVSLWLVDENCADKMV